MILMSCIFAGVYGILHDQVTYTISPEYFTKFKYIQFRFEPEWFGGHRPTVAVVGFLATWWVGLIIGFVLGIYSLFIKINRERMRHFLRAVLITLAVAIIFGFVGFLYAKLFLMRAEPNWIFPPDLLDKRAFITVGSIHNFSYLGGLLGLVAGIIFLKFKVRNQNRINET